MKHIILFAYLLFAVQIGTAQETWNACNSTVTVIPAPSYDSTFVLEAPSRAALQKGMANWVPATSGGGAASYLVYTALLTQSGTSAPVATVLENTLGGTVVWSYDVTGSYIGTLSGAFIPAKTIIMYDSFSAFAGDGLVYMRCGADNNTVLVKTYFNEWAGYPAPENSFLSNTYIQILAYP